MQIWNKLTVLPLQAIVPAHQMWYFRRGIIHIQQYILYKVEYLFWVLHVLLDLWRLVFDRYNDLRKFPVNGFRTFQSPNYLNKWLSNPNLFYIHDRSTKIDKWFDPAVHFTSQMNEFCFWPVLRHFIPIKSTRFTDNFIFVVFPDLLSHFSKADFLATK